MDLNTRQLKQLAALRIEEGILSVYIKIDPVLGYDINQPVAKFKGALRRFARNADEPSRTVLEREKDKVLAYLKAWEPHGRGLAIFSSQPGGIWETFELAVPVASYVSVAATPQTAVLAQVLDDYPRLAAVLIDGESARIYTGEQAHWERGASVASDVPGRHHQGGWAQARFQRHIEFHEAQHLKKVATELGSLSDAKAFNRLVLVGADEALRELEGMLGEPLSKRIIGHLTADFKQESDSEILERVGRLASEAERRSEEELVQRIVDDAGAGGRAVVGLEETIKAVAESRVQTLAMAEGIIKEGTLCPGCDFFAAQAFDSCPACGASGEPLPDVVDYATERVILQGGSVDVLTGKARDWLLAQGGLGAVLRYQLTPTP